MKFRTPIENKLAALPQYDFADAPDEPELTWPSVSEYIQYKVDNYGLEPCHVELYRRHTKLAAKCANGNADFFMDRFTNNLYEHGFELDDDDTARVKELSALLAKIIEKNSTKYPCETVHTFELTRAEQIALLDLDEKEIAEIDAAFVETP